MSLIPSLLLYNPLEALVIILICDLFTGRKFKPLDIVNCYVLGTINLAVQYVNLFITNTMLQLFYNIFVSLVVTAIIAYVYYNRVMKCRLKFRHAFYALVIQYISIAILVYFLNNIVPNAYTNVISVEYELISNIILRTAQLIVIFAINFIRRKKNGKVEGNVVKGG